MPQPISYGNRIKTSNLKRHALCPAISPRVREFARLAVAVNHKIEILGKLVIAAVNGCALGGGVPKLPPDPFPAQLEAVLDAGAPIFSFTFGSPDADSLARLKAHHVTIIGTATTVAEANLLAVVGIDAIVAQGRRTCAAAPR
jgi:NAD(P)H-dependent flavin oxidoreductase YrpB (nitropropane dioxygenase family)